MTSASRGYWVGVASHEHVRRGVAGSFCQLCHGKRWPLERTLPGDRIVYYSPREAMRGGAAVQAFTAIGAILEGEPYAFDMGGGFVPIRRDVRYLEATPAAIQPLLQVLSFTRDRSAWGYVFRRGFFGMTAHDYAHIAQAMGVLVEE